MNETEQLVLLALVSLGEDAYGVPVRDEIEARSGRAVSVAAVYATLARLEERGYAASWRTDPLPERGGRARKHYSLTSRGAEALLRARREMERMWDGLDVAGAVEGGS